MADQGSIANLKQNINENIYDNTEYDISGGRMNTVLQNIVDTLNALSEGKFTNIGYYVCDRVGYAPDKYVEITGYENISGGAFKIKFTNKNISDEPVTLNINSEFSKPLFYNGKPVSSYNTWEDGEVVVVFYDGNNFYAITTDIGKIVENQNNINAIVNGVVHLEFASKPLLDTYIPKGTITVKLTNQGSYASYFAFEFKNSENTTIFEKVYANAINAGDFDTFIFVADEDIYSINVTQNNNYVLTELDISTDGSLVSRLNNDETQLNKVANIVGFINDKHLFTSDEYVNIGYDSIQDKIVPVSENHRWKSVIVPVKAGMTYQISNQTWCFLSVDYPSIGMTSEDLTVVSYPSRTYLPQDSQYHFLMIGVDAESNNTTIASYLDGYVEITEHKNKGIVLGDSNVQASGISVGVGEDAPTIMGLIMGADVDNGGIGGTSYADDGVISFNNIADALVSRDFTQIDAGLQNILTQYPDWTFLTDRWAKIKQTALSDYNFMMLAYGTNDWAAGRTLDNPNNKFDVDTILGSLRYGVKTIMEANPNIRVYVVTPAYRYGFDGSNDNDSDNYPINGVYLYEICDAIFDACKELHVPCLNFYYTSNSNKYNRSAILDGGTHRTRYGYRLMAQQYVKFMLTY